MPKAMPSTPPNDARTRLSVSNCATMRDLPAPSAERTASSRDRTLLRASSRLATLAQQQEQHEADDAKEEERCQLQLAPHDGRAQRLDVHTPALVTVGVVARESFAEDSQLGLRSFERHARLESPYDLK